MENNTQQNTPTFYGIPSINLKTFIKLTLNSTDEGYDGVNNIIRIRISSIEEYVAYEYGDRCDGFTTVYMKNGKKWTVKETPEEIDKCLQY